jgi:hypothetical protein
MIIDPAEQLKSICHQMSYGDDSKETWKRYCELMGIEGTEEELEQQRQETFYDH